MGVSWAGMKAWEMETGGSVQGKGECGVRDAMRREGIEGS